jgi:hypothetical protein
LQELGASLIQDPITARGDVLTQIQSLSACCRGIQAPTDDYQTLTAKSNIYDLFASGQLTTMYSGVDGFVQMTAAIGETVRRIAALWSNDEEVMKVSYEPT